MIDGKELREILLTLSFTFQFNRNLNRGLEGYESSSSYPQNPQRLSMMENGKQDLKPSFTLGSTWVNLPEDMSKRDTFKRPYGNHKRLESKQEVQNTGGKGSKNKGESIHYPIHRKTFNPQREYSDNFRLTWRKPTRLPHAFTPLKHQKISGQEFPISTIPGSLQ
ncbi:hypothetical protein O181_078337 [Austropuccinia psidii MF-1]|uniref:Uncharacterized protein n=1 Tax=Austropuccinia psidii MF-1 TaxID=1389203 RepID=A0A9Q3FK80_9BASI|nr:hypothetical protein [Austropuccinia psidii MF-1]